MKKANILSNDINDVKTLDPPSGRSVRAAGRPAKSRVIPGFQRMWSDLRRLEQQVAELQAAAKSESRVSREPQSLAELGPRRQPEEGKTAMEIIAGQWPSDEEPEDLLRQLKENG